MWVGVLIFLLLVLSVRHLLLLNGLKQVRGQLKEIREGGYSNQLVTNPYQLLELNGLLEEINESLRQNQKNHQFYQEKEQSLKEQMTNISHDLRTPLASILGYFELINDKETTKGEQEEYLGMIQKRALLLRNLLDNYYDLARLESEQQSLVMESLDVNHLLNEILATFYYDFTNKEIAIELPNNPPKIKILANEPLLQRALVNLLSNVLKHGCKLCRISHQLAHGQQITTIANKVSHPEKIMIERVFGRSYSGSKSRTSQNTGIGLTVTKLLLEKMGHQVRAELIEDEFAIFIDWRTKTCGVKSSK